MFIIQSMDVNGVINWICIAKGYEEAIFMTKDHAQKCDEGTVVFAIPVAHAEQGVVI